jgi:hypothetical protein
MRHAGTVTNADATVIGAAIALVGVGLALGFNAWLARRKERKTARQERDQAIAELLTAAADLISGVQAIRAAYDRSRLRDRIRRAAHIWIAMTAAFAGEDGFITRAALGDLRKRAGLIERLLVLDRDMSGQQRVLALDLATLMLPRTSRFFASVAVLTLGDDREIADAVRAMTPAVTGLLEATAAKDRKYEQARSRAEKALGKFRDVVDQRDR